MPLVTKVEKGKRVTGSARTRMGADLKKKYEKGASIRTLARLTGRSYGFVHRILSESGVQLRAGPHRRRSQPTRTARSSRQIGAGQMSRGTYVATAGATRRWNPIATPALSRE